MNTALHPEVIRRLEETPQAELPLATEGTLRYVWESRFGTMLTRWRTGPSRSMARRLSLRRPNPSLSSNLRAAGLRTPNAAEATGRSSCRDEVGR